LINKNLWSKWQEFLAMVLLLIKFVYKKEGRKMNMNMLAFTVTFVLALIMLNETGNRINKSLIEINTTLENMR
jgi:hypothetical protein